MAEFHLETERLIIRNWHEQDRDLFHLINSDDKVMEFFPFRRDRVASDAMMDEVRNGISKKGFGFTALAIRKTNQAIGFCGLANANLDCFLGKDAIEIGWRLASAHWGKGYVTEAAMSLLDFAFTRLDLDEVFSFAVHDNYRSLAVMKRIGMIRRSELDFDHPKVPESHPQLKKHFVYSIKNPRAN